MQPITDLSLLKHHRVDHSASVDMDGARRRPFSNGTIPMLLLAVVALSIVANFTV